MSDATFQLIHVYTLSAIIDHRRRRCRAAESAPFYRRPHASRPQPRRSHRGISPGDTPCCSRKSLTIPLHHPTLVEDVHPTPFSPAIPQCPASTTPCASSRSRSSRTYIRRKNNVLVFSIPARAFRTDLLRPPILMPPAAISICAPARYYIFLDLEFPHHAMDRRPPPAAVPK